MCCIFSVQDYNYVQDIILVQESGVLLAIPVAVDRKIDRNTSLYFSTCADMRRVIVVSRDDDL